MRTVIVIALLSILAAAGILAAEGKAMAESRETCTWSDSAGQWLEDGSGALCRGTGEDPTVDAKGNPQCANGSAGHYSGGRFMCTASVPLGSVQQVSKPRNPNPCQHTDSGYRRESLSGTEYRCKPKNA